MADSRAWLVQLAGVFATTAGFALIATAFGPGCQTRCFSAFDCGEGSFCDASGRCETECFTDRDCQNPPECEGNPTACECKGLRCDPVGRCVGRCLGRPVNRQSTPPGETIPPEVFGWEDPPGEGTAFIVDSLAIAGAGRGFDVDGQCRGTGDCIDNSLHQLGQLGNDQIRQGVRSGETLLLIELAGLDEDYAGNDRSLTTKFYGARDADEPFFTANNFHIPVGDSKCCEFKIDAQSVPGIPPQATARAPAKIERGQLLSLAPVRITFTLTVGTAPHPELTIDRVRISARLVAGINRLELGLLGGAIPVNTLAQTDNPYCKTLNSLCPRAFPDSKLIDLIASILQPDVDLDLPPDGLETLRGGSNGRVTQCFDGCSGGCEGRPVPPVVANEPHTCALQPQMADGYSVALTFSGVAAKIVGVGQ